MTSPRTLTSGPPELPGLMAASVWMKSWMLPWPRPGSPLSARPLALTMPRGDREGEPLAERIADGQHPLADPGVVAVAERHRRQDLASILSTATSVLGSVPMTLALNSRRSSSRTVTCSAPSTTWLLVRM